MKWEIMVSTIKFETQKEIFTIFLVDSIKIQTFLIQNMKKNQVKKFIFL